MVSTRSFSRSVLMASVAAVSLALSACNDDGGVNSTPTPTPSPAPTPSPSPTPSPTPTPTPTPAAGPIAGVVAGPGTNATPTVEATGGASFDAPISSSLSFPVSQLAVNFDAQGNPTKATVANANGATVTQSASGLTFTVNAPAAGITNVPLVEDCDDCYSASLSNGRTLEVVLDGELGGGDLSYLRFGEWAIYSSNGQLATFAPLIGGFETPGSGMPTSGTATYAGEVEGYVTFADGSARNVGELEGVASISVDFAANSLTGAVSNMEVGYESNGNFQQTAWNDVSFSASLSGNDFSGTTAVTNTPAGAASLQSGAVGTVGGSFYGPAAEEVGAVWSLSDGTNTALGTIAGIKQ